MKQSTIKIDFELHKKLKIMSIEKNIGLSKMIDFILKEYLEKKDEMSSQDIPQIHRRVQK
jgi:hypothetical protein